MRKVIYLLQIEISPFAQSEQIKKIDNERFLLKNLPQSCNLRDTGIMDFGRADQLA